MPDLFTLECSDLPDDTHVVGFRGREALSEPYRFDIGIRTLDGDFDLDKAVLSRARLVVHPGEGEPYSIHGVLASVELLHDLQQMYLYRAVLVPKLWTLTLTRHSNVWTDESIDKVIEDVLTWSGLTAEEFKLQLEGTYNPREIVAQYKESNLHFICRWMERLGMYYYFEQGDEHEKLIITDGKSFTDDTPKPTARYVASGTDDVMGLEAFRTFRKKTRALPANVELYDYDYLNPTLDVKGEFAVASAGTVGELSYFGDDNFLTPAEGTGLAKIRAQQLLSEQTVFRGEGRVFRLAPGFPFQLEEHPRSDITDKTYLVTCIEHMANQSADSPLVRELLNLDSGDEYGATVRSILGSLQYRAPTRHPWPRVEGYESATVCGEADSEYAQIDEHGRYKVRIKFDESDLGDGKASAFVRMQQPYGGTNEGFHFPLVKNTEVLLWFMGGDPDRPVIAGVVPNVLTPSPVTVNNHTKNIIQTINLNLIEIEDTLNQQYVYVYCPVETTWIHMGVLKNDFNLILNTEGHVHFDFTGKQVIDIDLTLTENVLKDVTFNYKENWIVNVTKCTNVTIDEDWNLTVKGDVNWTILGDWVGTVLGDVKFMVGGDEIYTILGDQKYTILGDQVNLILGDQNHTIIGDQNLTVMGKQNVTVTSDDSITILGHKITLKSSNDTEITVGLKNEVFIGMKNGIFVGGQLNLTIANLLEIKSANAIGITLGNYLNLMSANQLSLTGGNAISIDGGLRMNAHAGVAISAFAGVKIELEAAVEIKTIGGAQLKAAPIEVHL